MRYLGMDLGSRSVKIAILEKGRISDKKVINTMQFYRDYSHLKNGEVEMDFEGLGLGRVDGIICTGYGRNNVKVSGALVINEVKAHVYGALCQTGLKDFTMLDIGGQDFKLAKVEKGIMTDLVLNDKCAASSGRYIENMAQVLEIDLNELAVHFTDPVELSSICAVFAESELIGKVAEKYPVERLAAGVNHALYKKIQPFLKDFSGRTLVLTGGVAYNPAIRHFLSKSFREVIVPDEPQLNGAIGCGYLAMMKEEQFRSA